MCPFLMDCQIAEEAHSLWFATGNLIRLNRDSLIILEAMMTVKQYAHGPCPSSTGKPAIHPATVDLRGKAYELLRQNAAKFLIDDVYRNPGPIQFEGPGSDVKVITLCLEDQDYMGRIKMLQEYLDKVRDIVKPGCSQDVLKAALGAMASVTDVLSLISAPSFGSKTPV